jgi:D-arabinose 1-dehydrogenase-like Zn-dependent alcohol dehydrogenase
MGMRAVVQNGIGGPEVLAVEDRPAPEPGSGQVLIAVEAFGVCRRDAIVRAGILTKGVALPIIPGHELAGTIAAVGAEVEGWGIGDRVTVVQTIPCGRCRRCREGASTLCERLSTYGHDRDGGYATHTLVEERSLVRVPAGVPLTVAAIAGCAAGTAYHGLRHVAAVEPGDVVLITGGSGGTGIHAIQVARLLQARVVAVTRREEVVPALREAGAEEVIVGGTQGLREELERRLGRRADVVFDTVGSAVFDGAWKALRHGGRYVLFGQTSRGEISFSPAAAFLRGIDFLSVTGTPMSALERVLDCLDRGLLEPIIEPHKGLESAIDAHHRLADPDVLGRLVVTVERNGECAGAAA